jgi:hypothetical protein
LSFFLSLTSCINRIFYILCFWTCVKNIDRRWIYFFIFIFLSLLLIFSIVWNFIRTLFLFFNLLFFLWNSLITENFKN